MVMAAAVAVMVIEHGQNPRRQAHVCVSVCGCVGGQILEKIQRSNARTAKVQQENKLRLSLQIQAVYISMSVSASPSPRPSAPTLQHMCVAQLSLQQPRNAQLRLAPRDRT